MKERHFKKLPKQDKDRVQALFEDRHQIFSGTTGISEILENSKVQEYEPYQNIWDDENQTKPAFSLILNGCVAVMYDGEKRPHMNALLVPGQVYGEFEFMKPDYKSNGLKTLSKTEILVPHVEDVMSIQKKFPGVFYKNLSNELIHKLYRQNHYINFRSHTRINERIAYFLYRLHHQEFSGVIRADGDNAYEIDIYFSISMFESFINSQHMTICQNIRKLLKQNVVAVTGYDKNFGFTGEWDAETLESLENQSRNEISETDYFKFTVTDLINLKSKNSLKNLK